ncbi:MAG: TerD family protein [Bacteroidetes bacterium]|nr:TerD family protein [Bacteroidota bacterium]
MGLNLKKGDRFNLAKEAASLKIAGIGLGWDPNETPGGPNFDLDVSSFLLTKEGKVPTDDYVVFYNSDLIKDLPEGKRPFSGDESVLGAVDAIDGEESDGGDDEDMRIYFNKVWEGITDIVITVSITKFPNDKYKDKRTLDLNFGMVQNCYVRAWDDENGTEIFKYNLAEKFTNEDALEFGRFTRLGSSWEFRATGEGFYGGLPKLIELFT